VDGFSPSEMSPAVMSPSPLGGSHAKILESFFSQLPPAPDSGPPRSLRSYLNAVPVLNRLIPTESEKQKLITKYVEEQKRATNFESWYDSSLKLDCLLNNNSWKLNPQSDLYDYDLIYRHLNDMRAARKSGDFKLLLYLIRTRWIRNLGNIGDIGLYRHSFVGTKQLIEEYIDECKLSLDYLVKSDDVNLDDRYLLGMLIQTRKNIGRTALLLSGGSTFGIFHIGVLITLLEANLVPRIISGSSAGSIVASIICSRTNEETSQILQNITRSKFDIFSDESYTKDDNSNFKNLLNTLSHFLKYGTLFDTSGLKETMIGFVGDLTFKEAYNRTGKILNITVSPASIHEQTKLLNYLTAPNCLIWSVVCASCSLPGVFPSTTVYEKNPRTGEIQEWNNDASLKFVDGSVDNDLPIARLSEMFNVDHIIAVQVNPHVAPILKVLVSNVGGEVENELSNKFKNLLNNVYDFVTCEAIHYLQILNEMDIYKNLANKIISILSQNYSGDITILPDIQPMDFLKLFENPSPDFLVDLVIRGAKASWPKVTVINNHCGVEFALDKAISTLRGKLITSSNNRITAGTSNSLVSPNKYLTDSANKITRRETTPPMVVRRNTTSGSGRKSRNSDPRLKKSSTEEEVSVSRLSPSTRRMSKGRSTTSLYSMYMKTGGANETDGKTRIDDNNKQLVPVSNPQRKDNKIRKAKSSTNFRNTINHKPEWSPVTGSPRVETRKANYPARRVPDFSCNPYNEEDGKSYNLEQPPKMNLTIRNEGLATLPCSNTLKNSYIGLNRLKDNDISRSNNGSNNNLKGYATLDSKELFKRLDDPNLRKMSIQSPNNFDNETIITSDNDEEIVKLEIGNEFQVHEYLGDSSTDGESGNGRNENDDDRTDNDLGDYYGIGDTIVDTLRVEFLDDNSEGNTLAV
jgi:TAG lipase/steryl ester hydrolase/phospholipase A2/LPA acyltransferase